MGWYCCNLIVVIKFAILQDIRYSKHDTKGLLV